VINFRPLAAVRPGRFERISEQAIVDGIRLVKIGGYWEPAPGCCDRYRQHQFRTASLKTAAEFVRADHPKEQQ
jgi:hypothetical protein